MTMVIKGSEDDLTPQDRLVFEKVTGEKAHPYRYAGVPKVIDKLYWFQNLFAPIPKTKLDWAIMGGMMAAPALGAIWAVADALGLAGRGVIAEAPEAIKAASKMPEVIEEVTKVIKSGGKIEDVPQEVLEMVNKRLGIGEQKLLGDASVPAPRPGTQAAADAVREARGQLEGPEQWTRGHTPETERPVDESPAEQAPRYKQVTQLPPDPSKLARLGQGVWKAYSGRFPGMPLRGATAGTIEQLLEGKGAKGAKHGALRGAYAGTVGAALGKGWEEVLSRTGFGEQLMINDGVRQFGSEVQKEFPELGQLKNPNDLDAKWRSGAIRELMGSRRAAIVDAITKRVMGHTFKVPAFGGGPDMDYSFPEASAYINEMEARGRGSGPFRNQYKMAGAKAKAAVVKQLNDLEPAQGDTPGMGDYWGESGDQYGASIELTNLFRREGVFGGRRGIDWPKVQALLAGKYRGPLRTMFGPEASERIISGAYRGAPPTVLDDPEHPGIINRFLPQKWRMGTRYKPTGDPEGMAKWIVTPEGKTAVLQALRAYRDHGDENRQANLVDLNELNPAGTRPKGVP